MVAMVNGNETQVGRKGMAEDPRSGLRSVILMWVLGLTLGVAAGAGTAMLLMPSAKSDMAGRKSIAEQFRSN